MMGIFRNIVFLTYAFAFLNYNMVFSLRLHIFVVNSL